MVNLTLSREARPELLLQVRLSSPKMSNFSVDYPMDSFLFEFYENSY